MEYLRFGSSIPGSYWGCCACCIIQNFKVDPAAKASIQLVSGDGGTPMMENRESIFAGPTWEDIFWQRLRIGTFSSRDMPNHAFLAILTEWQVKSEIGKKWLAILRKAGFEFIRAQQNSVYTGASLGNPTQSSSNNVNYIFGLFRNIGAGALKNPFAPPKEWTALDKVKPEPIDLFGVPDVDLIEFTKQQHAADTAIWNNIGVPKFLKESELVAAEVPITYAGKRSAFPQQTKEQREGVTKQQEAMIQLRIDKAVAAALTLNGVDPKTAKKVEAPQPATGQTVPVLPAA